MKFENYPTYLMIFFGACFFILSITNAGMFLNDEWVFGNQLHQLDQFHQITYNEGKYGYYENGTIGKYFDMRGNILMYSAAYPMMALPILKILTLFGDNCRIAIIMFWLLCFSGFYIGLITNWIERFGKERVEELVGSNAYQVIRFSPLAAAAVLLIAELMILSGGNAFPFIGENIPHEVLAFTLLNVILYGAFALLVKLITEELWTDYRKQIFGFIAAISCSSLMFWVGTCKDHVLIATIVAAIIWLVLYFHNNKKEHKPYYAAALLVGLLAWVRPEVAVGVAIAFIIASFIMWLDYYRLTTRSAFIGIVAMATGSIPLFINNYLITGNPLSHPFLIANAGRGATTYGYYGSSIIDTGSITITHFKIPYINEIIRILFLPESGAASIATIIPIVILCIILIPYFYHRRIKLTQEELILFTFGILSPIFYLIYAGVGMQADMGIIPDIRYLSVAYMPLVIASVSYLEPLCEIPVSTLIKNTMISFAGLFTVLLTIAASMSLNYMGFSKITNIITSALILYAILSMTKERTSMRKFTIPLLIALPFTWQFIMTFVYCDIKIHAYPMLIPLAEILHNLLFI